MNKRIVQGAMSSIALALLLLLAVPAGSQGQRMAMPNDLFLDLTSMVGKAAPAFTLRDSEGVSHTITPGDGRAHLVVFHMGSV